MSSYTCSHCKNEYAKVADEEWSDEQADLEFEITYGRAPDAATDELVCDDCYTRIMAWAQREGLVRVGHG